MSESVKITEKQFLRDRTVAVFKTLSIFDKHMIEESAKQNSMVETIKTLKSGNSELTYKDVEAILQEIRERHYTLSLIDKDARATVESLTELLRICKALEIDLELEEKDQEILNSILEGNKPIYGVVDSNVTVVDTEKMNLVMSAIKEKDSDPSGLERFFNSNLFK